MATLTIPQVDRSDKGLYRCEVKSHEKAEDEKSVELIINYMKISTTSIVDCKTDWLVTSISVISGIIFGILFCCLIFLCYGRRWLVKKSQMSQSHDARTNTVNTTYEELDLSKRDDRDKYESLRKNNDDDNQYQELNKVRDPENNYQSLNKP
ncbi:uncharacterized protein LOC124451391 isoform X1 [Xenia sp. Carnegie-2017]|uniref:uncharacterized protein LOC124451391 isoform X1 n=1 Tax=Xenia sp. Carnegie-2017 TaxID=2897299 RepID=UPI001F044EA9|nr:uncharacterized protein LOC124451391 isoform X1 [Xenia sp. Carnegie-2017]